MSTDNPERRLPPAQRDWILGRAREMGEALHGLDDGEKADAMERHIDATTEAFRREFGEPAPDPVRLTVLMVVASARMAAPPEG